MTAALNHKVPQVPFTAQDYFEWEAAQAQRHDYYQGEVFAMAGGTDNHNVVSLNTAVYLKTQLKGTACRVYMSDVRMELVKDEHYCYPDVFVTCDPRDATTDSSLLKKHPRLVIEVLSPSTSDYDLGMKLHNYLGIETLEQALFLNPEKQSAILYTRSTPMQWTRSLLHPDEVIDFTLGFSVPLAELFIDML